MSEEEPQKLVQVRRRKPAAAPPEPEPPEEEDDDEDEDDSEEEEDEPEELGVFNPPPSMPQPTRTPPKVAVEPPTFKKGDKPESLEDLYAIYPDIGNGSYRLRVIREQPKNYGGMQIRGILEDVDHKISMDEFRTRYGGGTYVVQVFGPMPGRDDALKVYAAIQIQTPGPPAPGSLPGGEDIMMGGPRFMPMEAPNVQIKRLDLEQKQFEQERAERQKLQSELQEQRKNDPTVDILRQTIINASVDLKAKEEENRHLRDEIVNERSKSAEKLRDAEKALEDRLEKVHQVSMQALKDRYETELKNLRDRYDADLRSHDDSAKKELESVRKSLELDLKRNQDSYRDELARISAANSAEVVRIQAHATSETDRNRKALEDQITNLRLSYDGRLADLQRATDKETAQVREQRDREISNLKMTYDREIANLKMTYDQGEKFTNKSTELQISTLNAQLERSRSDYDSLKREADALRKAQNKDPATFIRETKEMASSLLGMVDGAEAAAAAGGEEAFDWKKEAAKTAIGVFQKLPDIARDVTGSIAQARAQNQAMAQAQQAQAQAQAQARTALPPRKRGVAPDRWTGGAGYAPVANEIPFNPPLPPRIIQAPPQPEQQGPVVQPVAQPPIQAVPQQAVPAAQTQIVPLPQMPQEQVTQGLQAQPQPQPQQAVAPEQLQAGLEHFIGQLGMAFEMEVTPENFAKGFMDAMVQQFGPEIGPQQAGQLMQQLPVAQFMQIVDQASGGQAPILSRAGRDYTKQVWVEVGKLLGKAS